MTIDLDNITLNYTKRGNGLPLIFLHGNGEDHHIFDKLVDKLQHHFTIYAIDSRNHGKSSRSDDFGYEAMSSDIVQFIDKLSIKSPSVVGFSDGAIVALIIALSDPDLLGRMVLLGVNLSPNDFKEDAHKWLIDQYSQTNDPLIKLMLEEPNIDLARLSNISTPTLVVGAEDDLFKDDLFESIVSTMPNAELKIMPNHEHDTYIVDNDVLYPDLMRFFVTT